MYSSMLCLQHGCETWSLTLREERRLRVFKNGVLRGIFGAKRGEVTGEWRKVHNEELNDLCIRIVWCHPTVYQCNVGLTQLFVEMVLVFVGFL
jgi:hypothetical protein